MTVPKPDVYVPVSNELTDSERAQGAVKILGSALAGGDVLLFLGNPHRITKFTNYRGVLLDNGTLPAGTRVAYAGLVWGMTVTPDSYYSCLPRP